MKKKKKTYELLDQYYAMLCYDYAKYKYKYTYICTYYIIVYKYIPQEFEVS